MNNQRTHDLANALLALLHANTVAVNHGALRMVDDKHREPMRAAETQARATLLKHGYRHSLPPDSLETVTSDARRRDAFAAQAPDMPDWFRKQGAPAPVPSLDTLLRHDPRWNDLREGEQGYLGLWAAAPNAYKLKVGAVEGVGELAVQVGRRTEKLLQVKRDDFEHATRRHELRRLAAWRWVFADAMLELDPKNPGKQPPTARMVRVDNPIMGEVLMGTDILAALFGSLR